MVEGENVDGGKKSSKVADLRRQLENLKKEWITKDKELSRQGVIITAKKFYHRKQYKENRDGLMSIYRIYKGMETREANFKKHFDEKRERLALRRQKSAERKALEKEKEQ